MVDDHDARLVHRVEQTLRLARQHDRVRAVEAGVVTSDAELGAKAWLSERREVGRRRRRALKERRGQLTETEARAEGILPVEEEEHSRGSG